MVEQCVAELESENPEAAALLRAFLAAQAALEPGKLQEVYAGSFDLTPDCSLNLGYQIFGDDWRRSNFLADLIDRYHARRFELDGGELPDHLSIMLRFLAKRGEDPEPEPLIRDCLVPGLARVLKTLDRAANPYALAIEALLILLRAVAGCGTEAEARV